MIRNLAPKIATCCGNSTARPRRARLPGRPPVVLPNTGQGCWPLVPIAYGDVPCLPGVEIELNSMLASEAAANDAKFMDTCTDNVGHDVCQAPGIR